MIIAQQNVSSIQQVQDAIAAMGETASSIATDHLRAAYDLNTHLNAYTNLNSQMVKEAALLDVSAYPLLYY